MVRRIVSIFILAFMLVGCGNEVSRGMSTDPNEFPEDLQVLEIDATPTPTIVAEDEAGISMSSNVTEDSQDDEITLILNTARMKVHKPDCSSVKDIKPENIKEYTGAVEDIVNEGYQACKKCHPF